MRRRSLLPLLLFSLTLCAQAGCPLHGQLQRILQKAKAQVGVAVIIDGKDTLTFHNEARYPLMSVMKFHQALAVAHHLEQHHLPLSAPVRIEEQELLPGTYSPLRDRYPKGGITLSVGELLAYTLQQSDNNACDILFNYIGGTSVADRYIRSLGVDSFAISATEDDMHRHPEQCYANWSSPLATACLMDRLAAGTLPIDTSYTRFIHKTLLGCQTGKERLPAPLQGTQARIGHKTGTSGQNGKGEWTAINDAGFVLLPDGRRYAIAVFVMHAQTSLQEAEKIIADISAMVYRHLAGNTCNFLPASGATCQQIPYICHELQTKAL